jgi:hypothetical protein
LILVRSLSILFERLLRKKKYEAAAPVYVLAKRIASERPGRPDDRYGQVYWMKHDPRQKARDVKEWVQELEQKLKDLDKQRPAEGES